MKILSLTNNFNDKPIYINAEDIAVFYEMGSITHLKLKNDSEQYNVQESPADILKEMEKAGIEVEMNKTKDTDKIDYASFSLTEIEDRLDNLNDDILAQGRVLRNPDASPEDKAKARIQTAADRETINKLTEEKEKIVGYNHGQSNALPAKAIR